MKIPGVTAEMLQRTLSGRWVNGFPHPSMGWINARSDSREIGPGEVFVALSGSRTDGHDHLEDARVRQAAFAVVSRPVVESPLLQLLVSDTVLALKEMARLLLISHLEAGHRLVTLTGSVGKTTTRELLRLGLTPEGGAHASRGNENNEIGVPLTLLSWPSEDRYCILEVGIRKSGDMDYLAPLLSADAGIVTAIAPGHLETMGTVSKVWEEKSKLLKDVRSGGSLIMPDPVRRTFSEDPLFKDPRWKVASGDIGAKETLPGAVSASVRQGDRSLTLVVDAWGIEFPLPRPSMALAWCSLMTLLALKELGIDPGVTIGRLASYNGLPGRMERRELPSGLLLLLDHYNANPASMREALDWLAREKAFRQGSSSFAILGDMLELGEESDRFHEEVGAQAARSGIEKVWYRGTAKEAFLRGFLREAGNQERVVSSDYFSKDLLQGTGPSEKDVLLVKGSRGMKLEEVIAPLLERV